MTGGSLGLRTGSYGSLQQQLQSSVVLPIQTPSSRKNPKMLSSSSREKERFLPWICKVAGRRRVGMLLLVIVSVVVFTSLMSAVTKDEDASDVPKTHQRSRRFQAVDPGVRVVPSYYVPPSLISREEDTKSSISTGQVTMRDNNMSSILSEIPLVSSENKTSPPPFTHSYTLPPGHPCEHFALPPPPADKKRIGPRPCPVCYLPVDEAMALMPNDSSISPVLKNLSYIREDTVASTRPSGGSSFGGYPTLKQRSDSFNIKESMCVHCGFVKGNRPGQQTGFDIDDADLLEMEQCRGIVVASAIFGNYDIIQQPKNISEAAKRNICFYMFVDEETEAHVKYSTDIDRTMRVGLWRIVVVKNLPYADARRNGKVPKLLLHRIFTNARFSIWIDGKLELVVDPYQILERFLWRKGATFAISRHYRRFDVFEEAEANKVAAKYSNASIDAQIEFYKREGLTHYSHAKLPITSDVPEGCVIIREHIPITNLFTCLWFNEVDRFTSRDQLSFSTVRDKIMSKVDWSVYMFMDCERRNFVVQAYHRDILAQRMATIHSPPPQRKATIHPPPPPILTTVLPKTASQEIVPEKVVSTPVKKNSAKQNSAKRGRKERTSSRRHRKVDIGRDNNSI